MDDIEEIAAIMRDTPERIEPSVQMNKANELVPFYKGDFELVRDGESIPLTGECCYSWFPYGRITFDGASTKPMSIGSGGIYALVIKDQATYRCHITYYGQDDNTHEWHIKGTFHNPVIFGDKSIPVERVHFSIPNLKFFFGADVLTGKGSNVNISACRTCFKTDTYEITIDAAVDHPERRRELYNNGGYLVMYGGEIRKVKGGLTHEEACKVLNAFRVFLSFLNGRRTNAIFLHGIFEKNVVWKDYSDRQIDMFKAVETWAPEQNTSEFDQLWTSFYNKWKEDEQEKLFFNAAIHWYLESNGNSGWTEGSIILAQTALELLYNRILVEKARLLAGKDSENICASNKIRLLLSSMKIGTTIPVEYSALQQYIEGTKDAMAVDGPEAIVQIRNAIVHSQLEKRAKLAAIHPQALHEAWQLCVWYIEMSILFYLDYKGHYIFRCTKSPANLAIVPWKD